MVANQSQKSLPLFYERQALSAGQIASYFVYPLNGAIGIVIIAVVLLTRVTLESSLVSCALAIVLIGNVIYLASGEIETIVDARGISVIRKPAERVPTLIPAEQITTVSVERAAWFRLGVDNIGFCRWGIGGVYYFLNAGTGDHFVVITLADGRRFPIGSFREQELASAIRTAIRQAYAAETREQVSRVRNI